MGKLTMPEYIVSLLRKGKCNLFCCGEGGIGKTSCLIEVYRMILKDSLDAERHTMIPIFINLAECDNDEGAIRRKILRDFSDVEEFLSDEKVLFTNLQKLLENTGEYRFILILEALNEKVYGEILFTEIEMLSRFGGVSIVLTSREYKRTSDGWKKIDFMRLSKEKLSDILEDLEEAHLNDNMRELLSIPFFLEKYIEIKKTGVENVRDIANAFRLMEMYVKFTTEKIRESNSYVKIKESYPMDKLLKVLMGKIVPCLCFELAKQGKMEFSLWDKVLKKRLADVSEVAADMEMFCCSLLMPMDFVGEISESKYRLTHQIYRDFFAAMHLYQLFCNREYVMEELVEAFSGYLPMEVMQYSLDAFADKEEAMAVMREMNQYVGKSEELRKNAMLQKNIVDYCGLIRPVLEEMDFSYRNLTEVTFDRFCRLSVDFTGSEFGPMAFPCNKHLEGDSFQLLWSFGKYGLEKIPLVINDTLVFRIEKRDTTSTWAKVVFDEKVKMPRVKVLKCFEWDKKEPLLISENIAMFSEAGVLYTIDNHTMSYKRITDFNRADEKGDEFFGEEVKIEKAVECGDEDIVLQVNRKRSQMKKQLEFYKGRGNGLFELLFVWEYQTEVQTILCKDKIAILEEGAIGNRFLVTDYKGMVLQSMNVPGMVKMYSDDDKIYFWPKKSIGDTLESSWAEWELACYVLATGERNVFNVKRTKNLWGGQVLFDEGIKKIVHTGFFVPIDESSAEDVYISGDYCYSICEPGQKENEIWMRVWNVGEEQMDYITYCRNDKKYLLRNGMYESSQTKERLTECFVYHTFAHNLFGCVFDSVTGLDESDLQVLRQYGGQGKLN